MSNLSDIMHKYCERVEKELEEKYHQIEKTPQISTSDLEIIDLLLHSMKSIKTVVAMEDHDEKPKYSSKSYGYSSDYSRNRDNSSRYSGRNDSDIMAMLEDRMRNARSEDDALAIKDAMDAVSRIR